MTLLLIMALNLLSAAFVGHDGTHNVAITDTLSAGVLGDAEVVSVEFSYGEPQRSFDSQRGGRLASECTITIVGDEDRAIRDSLDVLTDERRYQMHVTGPRGDGTTYNWYGLVQGIETADTLSPSVYPVGDFSIRAICGLGLLQDRAPVFRNADEPKTLAEIIYQLQEAQGRDHGFTDVRASMTLREANALGGLNFDRLRIVDPNEQGRDSVEEQLDILCRNIHATIFQPTSAKEWWIRPHTTYTGEANIVTATDWPPGSGTWHVDVEPAVWPEVKTVEVRPDHWTASGVYGRCLGSGDIVFTGPEIGELAPDANFETLSQGLPDEWELIAEASSTPATTADDNVELAENAIIRARCMRLPPIENCAVQLTIKQEASGTWTYDPDHQANGGFALVVPGGEWYISVADGNGWVLGDPNVVDACSLMRHPIQSTADAVTKSMPLDDGGHLFLYLYGGTSAGDHAEISGVSVRLVDSVANKFMDELRVRFTPTNRLHDEVEIPLVTDWQQRNPITHEWVHGGGWDSQLTGSTYFTFAQAVAAERREMHPVETRPRWIEAEIPGIYTPEYKFTFKSGTDSPFDSDVTCRMVACELDLKRGLTRGSFIEIV